MTAAPTDTSTAQVTPHTDPRPAPRRLRWRGGVLAAGAIVLLTLVAYVPAMRAGFIWDDDWYVQDNLALRDAAGGLRDIWFGMRLEPVRPGEIPQYYPLVHTTFWLEYRLWGDDPTGYHVVNVLLHAGAAVLLWRLLRRLAVPGAWLAAAVFALHPAHVESVAWVTERKNVLSGFFYLAAALAYVRWSGLDGLDIDGAAPRRRRWGWYALALGCFVLALFAKTVTASLPAALLLVTYWKRGRIRLHDVWPLLPFFAVGIPLGLFTSALERVRVGAQGPEWDFTLAERVLIAGRAAWFYLGKLLWPHPLVFIYPRWDVRVGALAQWLFPLAAAGAVLVLWVLRHRIGRAPLVAVLFFGGTLFPALGFVNLLPMKYAFVADHFQYLASVAPLAGVAALATLLARRLPRSMAVAGGGALLAVLGALTWRQATVFHDPGTLWGHVLRHNPGSWMARINYGNWLLDHDRLDEAEHQFTAALDLSPRQTDAMVGLGAVNLRRGEHARAVEVHRSAVETNPESAKLRFRLALALREGGDVDGAIRELRRALAMAPDLGDARLELAILLARQGAAEEAVKEYRAVVSAERGAVSPIARSAAHNNLGILLAGAGDLAAAADHFRSAIELRPDFAEAHNNLGKARQLQGDMAGAVTAYEAALQAQPNFEPARKNLAAARAAPVEGGER